MNGDPGTKKAVRNGGKQEKTLITRIGPITMRRTVLKRTGERAIDEAGRKIREREVIALDEYLRVAGQPFRVSPMMMGEIAFWGQNQGSYQAAERVLKEKFGLSVTDTVIEEITDYVGGKVFEEDTRRAEETERGQADIPCEQNQAGVFYIMLDGPAVNTRKRDKNGSSWRENKLAVLFKDTDIVTRKNQQGEEERTIRKKTYVSYVGSVEEFKHYVFDAAVRAGCFDYKQVVIISDGAAWIRNMGEELFPDAVQILDFYHLAENIYGFGKYLFNNDAKQYTPWAERLLFRLKRSETGPVLALLKEYEGKKYGGGVINPYTYLTHNQGKADYARYNQLGYYIGSGPVESANKTIVQKRCKQAGMRWNVPTVQTMLTLRAKWESDRWEQDVLGLLLTA